MKVLSFVNCFLAAFALCKLHLVACCIADLAITYGLLLIFHTAARVSAQVSGTYTDPESGIIFATTYIDSSQTAPGFTLGIALPPNAATVSSNDYIGLIVRLLKPSLIMENIIDGLNHRLVVSQMEVGGAGYPMAVACQMHFYLWFGLMVILCLGPSAMRSKYTRPKF